MKKIILTIIIIFSVIRLEAFELNLFRNNSLIDTIQIDAKFVTGKDILILDKLFDTHLPSKEDRTNPVTLEGDIYLVARCYPKDNPGKRILGLTVEIISPEKLKGRKIELIKSGFLTRGAAYSLTKVIEKDDILSQKIRQDILKSIPEFKVLDLYAK